MLKNDFLKYAVKERMGRRNFTIERENRKGVRRTISLVPLAPDFNPSRRHIQKTSQLSRLSSQPGPTQNNHVHCPLSPVTGGNTHSVKYQKYPSNFQSCPFSMTDKYVSGINFIFPLLRAFLSIPFIGKELTEKLDILIGGSPSWELQNSACRTFSSPVF